jgi:hypothetical protein
MRSLKTPALLATVGLWSLGSLSAQDAPLPSASGLPIVSSPLSPQTTAPMVAVPTPLDVAPAPEVLLPVPDSHGSLLIDSSSVVQDTWMSAPAPAAHCGCDTTTPQYLSAPSHSCCGGAAPMMAPAPACGCQGGFGPYGGTGSYTMGSGSGVSSGILSPNANSGGLHTRYPYYNYRHPWHYQGPPSQNVTIVW